MKEYNIKHHYTTKHSSQFDKIVGQGQVDKIEHLKKQNGVLSLTRKVQNWWQSWVLSFVTICQKKESLSVTENLLKIVWQYSQNMHTRRKKKLADQNSLSRFNVLHRTNDLSDNIKESLKERLKSCETLDESTDISDTVQLVIFVRAVTVDFDNVKEFLDIANLSSTTIGQDICEQVLKVVEKFELNPSKL